MFLIIFIHKKEYDKLLILKRDKNYQKAFKNNKKGRFLVPYITLYQLVVELKQPPQPTITNKINKTKIIAKVLPVFIIY